MNITEDEAALYDRQIRLWGLDAQKRLRASSVLIVGLGGLGAEITKNLVLAGVKEVTLLDYRNVNINDTAQFLFVESDIGKNRAEASKEAAESLNPMVIVKTDKETLDSKSDDFFKSFSVICVTGEPTSNLLRLDQLCRKNNIKFYCGDVWGFYGYVFVDLGTNHTFVEEVKPKSNSKLNDLKDQTTELQQKTLEYPSLEKALTIKSGKVGSGIDKKTSSVLFITHVMLRFLEQNKRHPVYNDGTLEKDLKEIKNLKEEVMKELGVDPERLPIDFLENLFGEVSPVCAVVGGIMAQDIIKSVSGKDQPIRNFFLFDGESCVGAVEYIGK